MLSSTTTAPSNDNSVSAGDQQHPEAVVLPNYTLHFTLKGHKDAISSVKFSPDGQWLASASNDATVRIWHALTGQHELTLESAATPISGYGGGKEKKVFWPGHKAGISDIAWAPNSRYLASASDDMQVLIWDVFNPNPQKKVTTRLAGHTGYVFSVAFSPDGATLASASYDETVKLWDVKKGTCLYTLAEHRDIVTSVDFNREGTLLITASMDGAIIIWDTAKGEKLKALVEPGSGSSPVASVKFSPNGKYLLSSSHDSCLKLWSYHTGKILKQYFGHTCTQYCLFTSFSVTGGKWIVSGSEATNHSNKKQGNEEADPYYEIVLWNLQTKEVVQRLRGHEDVPVSISCHPTANVIASGALAKDCTVKLWFSDN